MKNETTTVSSGGIGFSGFLTLIFITLKLTGFIAWPWLWVLSPLWLGLAAVLLILGLGILAAVIIQLLS